MQLWNCSIPDKHITGNSCIEMNKSNSNLFVSSPFPKRHSSELREIDSASACDFYNWVCVGWGGVGEQWTMHLFLLPFTVGPRGLVCLASCWALKKSTLSGCLEQIRTKEKGRETPWSQHRFESWEKTQKWAFSPSEGGVKDVSQYTPWRAVCVLPRLESCMNWRVTFGAAKNKVAGASGFLYLAWLCEIEERNRKWSFFPGERERSEHQKQQEIVNSWK